MRPSLTSRPRAEHAEAVSRRLAALAEQLDAGADPHPDRGRDEAEWWREHTRVTAEPLGPPGPGPEPSPVPVPGRHATRRGPEATPTLLTSALPATLQGRVSLGSTHLTVVALIVAAGLALTAWFVLRSDPAPAEPAVPVAVDQAPGPDEGPVSDLVPVPAAEDVEPPSAGATSPAEAAGDVVVDVAGKVRRPGIVVLEPGARVVDAIEAAGGPRPGVDLTPLNLARVLVDGEQILVGVEGAVPAAPPAGSPGAPPTGAAPASPSTPVNLNTADEAELDTLPGVGPVTAAAIIEWRTEHGGFAAVTELLEVSGIGEVTLAELTPLVTV